VFWPFIPAVRANISEGASSATIKTNISINDVSITIDGNHVEVTSDSQVSVESRASDSTGDVSVREWVAESKTTADHIERYQKLQSKYSKVVEVYQSKRGRFIKARRLYRIAKNQDTEEELVAASKEWLGQGIAVLLSHLDKLEERVGANNWLSDQGRVVLLSDIGEARAFLEDRQQELLSTASMEEVREISQSVHSYWKKLRPLIKVWARRVAAYRLEGFLSRLELLGEQLEDDLREYEENVGTLSGAEDELGAYQSNVAAARESYGLALSAFEESEGSENVESPLQEAHKYLTQTHRHIRAAHLHLKKLARLLRKAISILPVDETGGGGLSASTPSGIAIGD